MSRRESYNEGWHEGRRRAERDLMSHLSTSATEQALRGLSTSGYSDSTRAWHLGVIRGYRDTITRYDKGDLTWEMFDEAPLGT